jgi:ACS family glucarate transporter-like MFS transporter
VSESGTAVGLTLRRVPWIRVRWKIFLLTFAFGVMAYVQQKSITVAAYRMMPDLGFTQMQIGWLETAFLAGYTVMQFPGGILGQRLGARRMFTVIGLVSFAATLVTPVAPALLVGSALFAALIAAQLLLGASQGPLFPVITGLYQPWFPQRQWSLVNGLSSMCLGLGIAITAPLIATLMTVFDWRRALLYSTLPALALIAVWAWYARNSPDEHPRVSAVELEELGAQSRAPAAAISWRGVWNVLRNRDVLTLAVSYLCMNYVFYLLANWCFLYLVQERHFTVLESGGLASVPPLAAALGAGIGGKIGDVLTSRHGVRRGLRTLPLLSLPTAAVLLMISVQAANAALAIVAMVLCFAAIELNEGPYWSAIMHVGGRDTMSAGGVLNTGGNAGGLIATPIIAYLSGQQAWTPAFMIGAALAVLAAVLWLFVDPTRRIASSISAGSDRLG